MGLFASRIIFALAAASATVEAGAQAPVASASPQVWELDWNENQCTISTGDPSSIALSVWITPGDPRGDLYLVGLPTFLPSIKGDKVTVTLMPGGESFSVAVMNARSSQKGVKAVRALKLGEKFPEAFAKASEIRVTGLQKSVSFPVRGPDKAMAALRQCIDIKLPEWGIDPKAYDALRMPPTDTSDHLWFSYTDYPTEALAAGQAGVVIARMNVDATGKVTNCAVVVSSSSKPLDDVTCSTAFKRGKFNPAIGSDGRPTAAVRIVRVVFEIAT